jgi:hypothetical protein
MVRWCDGAKLGWCDVAKVRLAAIGLPFEDKTHVDVHGTIDLGYPRSLHLVPDHFAVGFDPFPHVVIDTELPSCVSAPAT